MILHHGLGTNPHMERLARDARVAIPSGTLRHAGLRRIRAAPARLPWTLGSFVDDVIAVADAVGARRFHLIGESFGGTVSLFTAIVQGLRLLSATCISAPHRGGSIKVLKGWNDLLSTDDGMEHGR